MLSLPKCRELLANDADNLTDNELEALRSALYGLASVAIGAYSARKIATPDQCLALLPPEEREHAEERAAILEFDCGLSRTVAEQLAVKEVFERRGMITQLREIA